MAFRIYAIRKDNISVGFELCADLSYLSQAKSQLSCQPSHMSITYILNRSQKLWDCCSLPLQRNANISFDAWYREKINKILQNYCIAKTKAVMKNILRLLLPPHFLPISSPFPPHFLPISSPFPPHFLPISSPSKQCCLWRRYDRDSWKWRYYHHLHNIAWRGKGVK